MGNPALREFQDRLIDQLMVTLHAEHSPPNHPEATFDAAEIACAIEIVTADWKAKRSGVIRDVRGVHQDADDLRSDVAEPITEMVRITVSTQFTRSFTAEEERQREERAAAFFWTAKDGPPPKDVTALQLLDQDTWWVPKGNEPVRLVDMAASHRRNLLGFLRRNAAHYKTAAVSQMLWSMAEPLGPRGDMAMDAADHELIMLEHAEPLTWLIHQPLFQALLPIVYCWESNRGDDAVTCLAISEDGAVLAACTGLRRKAALRGVQPPDPIAAGAYRGKFGGVGEAFYRLITLERGATPPDAVMDAYREYQTLADIRAGQLADAQRALEVLRPRGGCLHDDRLTPQLDEPS